MIILNIAFTLLSLWVLFTICIPTLKEYTALYNSINASLKEFEGMDTQTLKRLGGDAKKSITIWSWLTGFQVFAIALNVVVIILHVVRVL